MSGKNTLIAVAAILALASGHAAIAQQQSGDQGLDELLGGYEAEATGEPAEPAPAGETNRPQPSDPTVDTIPVESAGEPEAPEAAIRPASRSRLVEEIVVTAQKREENIQDVPISISAFSGDALDAKGINDPKSLAQSIPGVTYGETVNFSIIYVRGVGTDAFLPDSDLSVAMYMDGIYFPFANGLSQSLGAIERVEVLKGPQGTLFGRNATGGAFNISSKTPSLDGPEFRFTGGYTQLDTGADSTPGTYTTRLYGNVPITETLAANLSMTYNHGDNYYRGTRGAYNNPDGQPFPKETEKGARLRVLWEPSEWLDLTLTGIKHRKDGLATTVMPNIAPSAATQSLHILTQGEPYTVPPEYVANIDVPSFFALDNDVAYGQLGLHPAWFDVKLLASVQDITTDNNYDFDGTRAPFITFDARGQFADVFTGELQFISNGESGPDWLEWVAGFYYLDQDVGFPLNRISAGGLDLSDGTIAGIIPVPQAGLDLLRQLVNQGVPLTDGYSLALISLQHVEASAYFGQTTAYFTDWMYLTLGGRFQEETRTVVESSISTANADGTTTLIRDHGSPEQDETNFSPKVVLGFKPTDEDLIYLSWSKGFKSGTFNTVNIYDEPEYVLPEEVTSYELGAKIALMEGQATLNAAAFSTEILNQQVQFISLLAGGAVQLENAGKVGITGAEAELTYTPDWDPGLFVAGSLTWLDSTYDSYPEASAYNEPLGLYNFRNGDFSGNRTVRTPEWSANLTINHLFEFSHGDFEVGLTGYYSSDFYFQASNSPISRQKPYTTLDGQVSYLHRRSNVRVSLLGKNLTDERYELTQFHTDAGVQHVLAPPFALGVMLDWTFGE
jgi:iron complex outermembrane recepter protein